MFDMSRKRSKTISDFNRAKALSNSYNTVKSNSELYNHILELKLEYGNVIDFRNVRSYYNETIMNYYPSETTIKATFINEVLFKIENQVSIFELPIGSSRADLCKINGTSSVFEIKTDLDSLGRLEKQLADYSKIFEKSYVICSTKRADEIMSCVPHEVGVYAYSNNFNNYTYKLIRGAKFSKNINSELQLQILNKTELKSNFLKEFSENKNEMVSSILNKYSKKQINSIFKKILKEKYSQQWEFLKTNNEKILEIDYQWFYKNNINIEFVYS